MDELLTISKGLYTDESPGLKVDPVVVLVLSLVFIFSVVALHSTSTLSACPPMRPNHDTSYCQDHPKILQLDHPTRIHERRTREEDFLGKRRRFTKDGRMFLT